MSSPLDIADLDDSDHLTEIAVACGSGGLTIADIGCGGGAMAAALARRGHRVVALECAEAARARAAAGRTDGGYQLAAAVGQALPLADGAADRVLFNHSLHHVPVGLQAQALREAHRALGPSGRIIIVEPIAAGPIQAVMALIDDETEVREAAQRAIDGAGPRHAERLYACREVYAGLADFTAGILAVDPARAAAIESAGPALEHVFRREARPVPGGYEFLQPTRLTVLLATASPD